MKRLLVFAQKCLSCDSELVTFVSRYAVGYGRMLSPMGRNIFHCSLKYEFTVSSVSVVNIQVIKIFIGSQLVGLMLIVFCSVAFFVVYLVYEYIVYSKCNYSYH